MITYAAPYSASREIYRVIIYEYDSSNKLLWDFEVWASREAIEDELEISRLPMRSDLIEFAKKTYDLYLSDWGEPPRHTGIFVSSKGKTYGDANTFPGSLPTNDSYIQTNISLPKSMHETIKNDSENNNVSMSELIRSSLSQYLKRSFVCSTCKKTKHGDPHIIYGDKKEKKDCTACFFKKFEDA